MATAVLLEHEIEIPSGIGSLEDFRQWARSDEFPETGRIDYISGRIEVDKSPEELYLHGSPKVEIVYVVYGRVKTERHGDLFSERTRVTSVKGDLSSEPDVVFVSFDAIQAGRVRRIRKASGGRGRFVEIEGAADLIVEIVSDSSVTKDTIRLPAAYYRARVLEFWLVDTRGDELVFQIHCRGDDGFVPVEADVEGFQMSEVLGCRYRLERRWDEAIERWEYDLLERLPL